MSFENVSSTSPEPKSRKSKAERVELPKIGHASRSSGEIGSDKIEAAAARAKEGAARAEQDAKKAAELRASLELPNDVVRAHEAAAKLTKHLNENPQIEEDAEWANMKASAVAEGAGKRDRADQREAARRALAGEVEYAKEAKLTSAAEKESNVSWAKAGQIGAEIDAVKKLNIQEFSPGWHKELVTRKNEIIDQLPALKGPFNFFKKRKLMKELETIDAQENISIDNYQKLRADKLSVEKSLTTDLEPSVRRVYEAQMAKINADLTPFEKIIARDRDRENATRKGERNPNEEAATREANRQFRR